MDPINEPIKENSQPLPPITAYCRACGKGLTPEAATTYEGTVYCAEHLPRVTSSTSTPRTPPPYGGERKTVQDPNTSPGLAFLLGLIPGVGAIYNGQYGKGFVHVLITGLLFSLAGSESGAMEPLFQMFVPVWFFYMAFEAYHTAKKRMLGESIDEFSSIFPNRGASLGFPILPMLLIAIGVLFLLNNLEILSIRRLMPYAGPVFLIALGCYMLYARMRANAETPVIAREVGHERN